jgi:hypothetical protein
VTRCAINSNEPEASYSARPLNLLMLYALAPMLNLPGKANEEEISKPRHSEARPLPQCCLGKGQ